MEIRKIAKLILGKPDLKYAEENYDSATGALKIFIDEHRKVVLEKNHLPGREDGGFYNKPIAKMEPAYNFFNSDVFDLHPEVKPVFEYDNFHSGTPMRYKPFPGSIREVRKTLRHKNLYWYPRSSGGYYSQQKIVDYLDKEGFELEPGTLFDGSRYGGIGVNNICFACSTTHAYHLITKALLRPNDVVLMTGPNYGLFAIMSELDNYHTEIIELKEEDDWLINPKALASKIDELNLALAEQYHGKTTAPRVAAFLNINPHNPTGKVMGAKQRDLLRQIAGVCKERNVFIIDDLVYRDLTYDQGNLALPIATMPEFFDNTISLFGLSKSFGLASIRAAVIVAPVAIAEVLGQEIHDSIDSMPVLQVAAVSGAFNGTRRRYREYKRYIGPLIREYQYRYALMRALVYGVHTVKDDVLKKKILRTINKYESNQSHRATLRKGCKGIKIRAGTEPESGFFAVFDFTELKGKTTPEGKEITNENDLLEYFFKNSGITYLMGGNIFWPNTDELVGRISFGVSRKAIVKNMYKINELSRKLK